MGQPGAPPGSAACWPWVVAALCLGFPMARGKDETTSQGVG